MKSKSLLYFGIFACVISVGAAVAQNIDTKPFSFGRAAGNSYSVTLNSSVFGASSLTTSAYQTDVTQNFPGNDKPVLHYYLAKKNASNNLVLAPAGKLFNYGSAATYKGRVTNITSVNVTYSGGTLFIQEGLNGSYEMYGSKTQLTSGSAYTATTSPNFIMISNATAATTISSIVINYSCSDPGFVVGRLGEQYNFKSQEGTVYTLNRSSSNVTIKEANTTRYSGTISVATSGSFTITLSSGNVVYTGNVSSDYHTLTVTSKSGSSSGSAPTIGEMNRIYIVDDFEKYTGKGATYQGNASHANDQSLVYVNSANSSSPQSDLRAAYYSDYGGGGNNTWINGSNFQIPTSSDYINYVDTHHGGSKAMSLKASTGGWMRYWSCDIFNQSQHYNFGRGNVLSFWTYNPCANAACTTNSTQNPTIRVQAYYQNFVINDSNRNSTSYGTGTTEMTISANSGWVEHTITLDPTKHVYAVNFMCNNSGLTANCYIAIDDITIYTTPVYEPQKQFDETDTKITRTYHGVVTIEKKALGITVFSKEFSVKLGLGANGYIYAYAGDNMDPESYTINGNQIYIVTNGSVSAGGETATFGNWTGTFNSSKTTITIQKSNITGTIKDYIKESSFVLSEDNILASGTESASTLQTIFKQQYQSGDTWNNISDSDSIIQTNNYYIQGNNSIRLKPYSSANMRIIIDPALAQSQSLSVDSISFWFYAPAGVNYTLTLFSYADYTPVKESGRYTQQASYAIKANDDSDDGWHYVNCGLTYNKNIAIFIQTTSSQTILDYITYF